MHDRTNEIIKRFENSWNETQNEFEDLINNQGFERFKPIGLFIKKHRDMGDNKFFRIIRTMDGILLSRSVDKGALRKDQKIIRIEAYDNGFDVKLRDGERIYREYWLENLEDIRMTKLLRTLKNTLVD